MILTAREKIFTRLVDFTMTLAQAKLKESVLVEIPKMYETTNDSNIVLKLNKPFYGLVQALLCWYMHLR